MSSFTDSVDDGGSYETGICGEKKMTLNVSTPSYLQLWYSVDYRTTYLSETPDAVE